MKTSDSLINISKAMAEAQKKISHATKDSKNPHFKNDYASLESVINASKEALLEHGIFVIQSVSEKSLVTRLQHTSGEFFESSLDLLLSKQDMQGLGSAITYARRYSLASMLNISQADDDGNEASKPAQQQQQKTEEKKNQIVSPRPRVQLPNVDFNTYIIKFSREMTGKKLIDFSIEKHVGMIKWLDDKRKAGESWTAGATEYHEYASLYIVSDEAKSREAKTVAQGEAIPV